MLKIEETPRIRILRDIHNALQHTKDLTAPYSTLPSKSPSSILSAPPLDTSMIPPLSLPFPEDILLLLRDTHLPAAPMKRIHATLIEWYQRTHEIRYKHYTQACRAIAPLATHPEFPSFQEKLRLAFEASFANHYVPTIKAYIASLKSRYHCTTQHMIKNKKAPFQHEYTPFLEGYFEYNAYPSVFDRRLLAEMTTMTERQIEVWFQNHRTRARKEGKVVEKLDSNSLAKNFSFETLRRKLPTSSDHRGLSGRCVSDPPSNYDSSEDDAYFPLSPASEASSSHPILDRLNAPAPAHAFPAKFPPTVDYDPFPKENGIFTFAPPTWTRRPASARPTSPPIDFDVFVATFAEKLNLRDGSPKKQPPKSSSRLHQPWFFATTTIPPCAPHPAFIRTSVDSLKRVQRSPVSSSFLLNKDPSYAAQKLSSSRVVPIPSCSTSTTTRAIKHLPRRTPSTASSNTQWGSRSSSFSSIASSDSSIEPSTPPITPATQTTEILFADADYLDLDGLFDGALNSTSNNTFSPSINPPTGNATSKHAPMFTYDLASLLSIPTCTYVESHS